MICSYNQLSSALNDVVDNSVNSPSIDPITIVTGTQKALCYFRIVLSNAGKKPKRHLRKLSDVACKEEKLSKSIRPTTITMVTKLLGAIKRQQNVVMDIHETLYHKRLLQKFLKKSKRRKNKCSKQKKAKHRIRGCKKTDGVKRKRSQRRRTNKSKSLLLTLTNNF